MDLLIKHVMVKESEEAEGYYGHVGIQDGKVSGIWTGDESRLPVAKVNVEAAGRSFNLASVETVLQEFGHEILAKGEE